MGSKSRAITRNGLRIAMKSEAMEQVGRGKVEYWMPALRPVVQKRGNSIGRWLGRFWPQG